MYIHNWYVSVFMFKGAFLAWSLSPICSLFVVSFMGILLLAAWYLLCTLCACTFMYVHILQIGSHISLPLLKTDSQFIQDGLRISLTFTSSVDHMFVTGKYASTHPTHRHLRTRNIDIIICVSKILPNSQAIRVTLEYYHR